MDCPVPLWVLKLGLERRRCDTVEPITHGGMVDTLRALLVEGASAAGVALREGRTPRLRLVCGSFAYI